jgi:methyltransferase-like protein
VDTEIKEHCDAIIEKINTLTSLANKKGQKKTLKKLKKKVKKIRKFSTKPRGQCNE